MKSVFFALFSVAVLAGSGLAQTTAAPKPPISGAITAVNASLNLVTVKTTTGETVDLTITPCSFILSPAAWRNRSDKGRQARHRRPRARRRTGSQLPTLSRPKSEGSPHHLCPHQGRSRRKWPKKEDEDWRQTRNHGQSDGDLHRQAKTCLIPSRAVPKRSSYAKAWRKDRIPPLFARFREKQRRQAQCFWRAQGRTTKFFTCLRNKNPEGTEIAAEKVVFGFFPPDRGDHQIGQRSR